MNTRLGKGKRPYRMTARAEAVEATREAICAAAIELWLDVPYDELTLDHIAERAGTTRQTILRHYGSKEGLALAAAEWNAPRIEAATEVEAGDIRAAVSAIVFQYEAMGDANVRLLEIEDRLPEVRELLERGRSGHRRWVEQSFAPFVERVDRSERQRLVDALYAATDVTVWKLLRRDFGRSVDATEAVLDTLVRGVLATAAHPDHSSGEGS
jgi:AcrR family transcriptional regulator